MGGGHSSVLICLRELTRTWNLSGSPGLASLRTHDFTAGQSFSRLPEALGPGEQTPALFSRTDSSGSFHLGCGPGRLWMPRGAPALTSPRPPRRLDKVQALTGRPRASGFLRMMGLLLHGARDPGLQTGGGGRSAVWPAARPGTSPAFCMTAGPVHCACLLSSRHGGLLGAAAGSEHSRGGGSGPAAVLAPWRRCWAAVAPEEGQGSGGRRRGLWKWAFAQVVPRRRGSEASPLTGMGMRRAGGCCVCEGVSHTRLTLGAAVCVCGV